VVDGLDVHVVELWFFEYRYLGTGKLRGGFVVVPHVMKVTTAVQDIGPGELRFGEKEPIARNFRGQVTCDIPQVNPEEHADASFMELVNARVQLKMDVLTLINVGAYFNAFDVSHGAGPLAIDVFMEKGYLGKKSKLAFATDLVRVKGDGFGVASDWRLDFDASGEAGLPLGQSHSKSTYVSLAKRSREFTVQIHDHHEEAALDTIRLGRATDLKRASLRMPNIVSSDLDDFNVLFPDKTPVVVQGGEAHASVNLDMDGKYWVRGPISAEILRAQLDVAGVKLSGNAWLKAQARLNPKQRPTTSKISRCACVTSACAPTVTRLTTGGWTSAPNSWRSGTRRPRARKAASASRPRIYSRRSRRSLTKTSSAASFPCSRASTTFARRRHFAVKARLRT